MASVVIMSNFNVNKKRWSKYDFCFELTGKNPRIDVGINPGGTDDIGDVGGTSSLFCSHPIGPGIFTNILRAGMFSLICLINPCPIGWYIVWWLNPIPKVCEYVVVKNLSSRRASWCARSVASCWFCCCSIPPSRTTSYVTPSSIKKATAWS